LAIDVSEWSLFTRCLKDTAAAPAVTDSRGAIRRLAKAEHDEQRRGLLRTVDACEQWIGDRLARDGLGESFGHGSRYGIFRLRVMRERERCGECPSLQ
jgi:hypothetical protein